MSRPRLLLVSMYPLDAGLWGPTVRITHLRDELARLADLDVIDGYRTARRPRLWRYALAGRLRGLDGIYVESSTFSPSESDLAVIGLAHALDIPIVTYVRDAYQLFPELYPRDSLKRRLAAAAFLPAMRALRAVSSHVAFPTAGLAEAVFGPGANAPLLPPGAPEPVEVPRRPSANRILYVGDARLTAQGADRLLEAVEIARARGVEVELDVVSRPGQEPRPPHAPWLRVHRAEGPDIHALLPDVVATAIPRPRTRYNDLALPITLFDYLSYGRPLLVTDCREQARVVADADAGLVTPDDPPAIADGIARFATAPADAHSRWSTNAAAAARAASWEDRAHRIMSLMTSTPR
jgi:glycosyltransferase involved in cell wall biosynthesis